jgi:protocatechuate 3,4-dioxygenase beta subunit
MKNRRDFIKKLGLGSLFAGVLPFFNLSAFGNVLKKKPLCDPTTLDAYGQGPFYTANAPQISNNLLAGTSEPGDRIIISGKVYTNDCITPIPNALIDVWHADDQGNYDNIGFNLRGTLYSDANGNYMYETIWPGKYPLSSTQNRPCHIHLKASAPGHSELTTQVYFANDTDIPSDAAASITSGTYDATDRIISMNQNSSTGKWEGNFDIILYDPLLTNTIREESLHINFGMITQCTPNPISSYTSINFSVFKPSDVEINLYDLSGKLKSKIHKEKMAPGKYEIDWNTNNKNLAGGFYLLSLQVNGLNVHNLKIQVL